MPLDVDVHISCQRRARNPLTSRLAAGSISPNTLPSRNCGWSAASILRHEAREIKRALRDGRERRGILPKTGSIAPETATSPQQPGLSYPWGAQTRSRCEFVLIE